MRVNHCEQVEADRVRSRLALLEVKPGKIVTEGRPAGAAGPIVPNLLELKAKFNTPLKFRVQIELGDGKEKPSEETRNEINKLLKELKDGFQFE